MSWDRERESLTVFLNDYIHHHWDDWVPHIYTGMKLIHTSDIGKSLKWGWSFTDVYMLATVDDDRLQLISLTDGNRWSGSVKCIDASNITKDKWIEITSNSHDQFIPLDHFREKVDEFERLTKSS